MVELSYLLLWNSEEKNLNFQKGYILRWIESKVSIETDDRWVKCWWPDAVIYLQASVQANRIHSSFHHFLYSDSQQIQWCFMHVGDSLCFDESTSGKQ